MKDLTLTPGKIAIEAASVAFGNVFWYEMAGRIGLAVCLVVTLLWAWAVVGIWRNEADVRENARAGFVEGQPLVQHTRYGTVREVTYIAPTYNGHRVSWSGASTYLIADTDELELVLVDIKR